MEWQLRTRALSTRDHTLIMGILNVTPDSFSDGGAVADADDAIRRGLELWEAGADIVDVGGESTRPYAEPVTLDEELMRVAPVVEGLVESGVCVSVDTSKPEVAEVVVGAGAEIINDVRALQADGMAAVCAGAGVGVVLMHMQGSPETMQEDPRYDDVVAEVATFLSARADAAVAAGIDPARICIDPGIGFGKTFDHNLSLLSSVGRFAELGYPLLLGTSRKGFLGQILESAGHPAVSGSRDAATGATVALAIAAGATVVRVHDVVGALQVARTTDAIVRHADEDE